MENNTGIAEIKKLYKKGRFKDVVRERWLFSGRSLPQELYPILIDSCIQSIFPYSRETTDALYYLHGKLKPNVKTSEKERIISSLIKVITDPLEKNRGYIIRNYAGKYDDHRIFEALIRVYRDAKDKYNKMAVVMALGEIGKREALPVLLDNFFAWYGNHTKSSIDFLNKYQIPKQIDTLAMFNWEIEAEDCDSLIKILFDYLDEAAPYKYDPQSYTKGYPEYITFDSLSANVAYILAIIYTSDKASLASKEKIRTGKNRSIQCIYADYMYDSFQYDQLRDYIKFENGF